MNDDFDPTGYLFSEKYDGQQGAWDGGISRGLSCQDVPYANTAKHNRYRNPPLATGLWSRYAQPIQAPDWFLDQLPPVPLVGELWAGFGNYQHVQSTVRCLTPGAGWKHIRYMIFDSPPLDIWLAAGEIDLPNLKMTIPPRAWHGGGHPGCRMPFFKVLEFLQSLWIVDPIFLVGQTLIESRAHADALYCAVLDKGGEGGIFRAPTSRWVPQRSHRCLKRKPWHDDEAEVIGYVSGRGRLLGRLGALIVRWRGLIFRIGGGLTDEDRLLCTSEAMDWACKNPETELPEASASASNFPRGMIITFKYRELSNDGVPKEARYWRKP